MKRKLYLLLWAYLFFNCLSLQAQRKLTFRIADFELEEEDLTARNEKYQEKDPDGDFYAIVKVKTDNPDDDLKAYKFDFGTYIDVKKTEKHDDALWIWVRQGAKKISVHREGYAAINQQKLGLTIQKGCTYNMLLSAQMPEVKHRILQFKVTPANEGAIVKVKREDSNDDFELWGTVDASGGKAQRLETGVVYLYEVTAEHYDKTEGRIMLTNDTDNYVETVTLKPNFGFLEVADEHGIVGAEIIVNDRKIGTVPYTAKDRWDVRDDYRIMISAGELYKTFNGTFSIKKGETTRLTPKLESNFAETTITVPDSAEILVEGVSRGHGKWTGPLRAGTYNVECRLDDKYRPTRRQITIKPDLAETFQMDAPTPITGSIYVNSNPLGATIQIDGKNAGQTPKELKEVLIGQHTIRIVSDGYGIEEKAVEVKEGQTSEVEFQLRREARFTINAQPQAHLTLDGKDVGLTPYSFDGASGDFDIRLDQRKYKTYHKKTTLQASDPEQTIRLQRIYQLPTSFFLGTGFQLGTLMGFNVHGGAYIKKFNVEVFATIGLSKETVYMNYLDGSASVDENLKATIIGGRLGYGFAVGSRWRITPQIGCGALTVKSDDVTATAFCATIGCRVDYALTSFLGINLTPEGQFAVSKKDVFTQISDLSSKVNGWGTGGGVRIGLYCFF